MRCLDVAIYGCGHMGRLHAQIVHRDPHARLVAVVDPDRRRADSVARVTGAEVLSVAPQGVGVVIIASPATTHFDLLKSLSPERWVLVEKPISHTAGTAGLVASARTMVGHSERFNPAVRSVGRVVADEVEIIRRVRPTSRCRDVDVLLDIMVHDLDLACHWLGDELEVVAASGLLADRVTAILRTTAGRTGRLLADRDSMSLQRQAILTLGRTQLMLDLAGGRAWRDGHLIEPVDDRDALTAQWDAFTDAVHGRAPNPMPPQAGRRAVCLAGLVREAVQSSSEVPAWANSAF